MTSHLLTAQRLIARHQGLTTEQIDAMQSLPWPPPLDTSWMTPELLACHERATERALRERALRRALRERMENR